MDGTRKHPACCQVHNREGLSTSDGEPRRRQQDQHSAHEAGVPAAQQLQNGGESSMSNPGLQRRVPTRTRCGDSRQSTFQRAMRF